jgi:hypothetical protein
MKVPLGPDPVGQERYLYSTEPRGLCAGTPTKPKDIGNPWKPGTTPMEPANCPGRTHLWQYRFNDYHGIIDQDLCDDAAYELMWSSDMGRAPISNPFDQKDG